MNRGALRAKVKRDYPEIDGYWEDSDINTEINLAALRVAYHTECLPSNTKIDLTVDDSTYDLDTLITNFLCLDTEGGVYYYENSESWEPLTPKTPDELNEDEVNWRDMSSGDPEYYYMEGSELNLVAPPDTSITEGLWVYVYLRPTEMDDDTDDPLNGMGYLSAIHHLIPLVVGAELKKSQGKWQDRREIVNEYVSELKEARTFIHGKFRGSHIPDIKRMPGYVGHFRSKGAGRR